MFNRILIALALAVVAFVVYLLLKSYKPSWFGFDSFSSTPAAAPSLELQARVEPPRTVSPAGPNPPNVAPQPPTPEEERQPPPDVTARDPLDDPNSSGDLQDNLRHPERSFSPGLKPTDVDRSVMSGVASSRSMTSSQALQTFAPEMAQNGGEFMQGIAANDTMSDTEFAAF
jgi:hypothetical protein